VDKFWASCKIFFSKYRNSSGGTVVFLQISFGDDKILFRPCIYTFQEPEYQSLRKISSRKILEHVSLSFNKRRHLKVCTCYGNDNVYMKPMSYRIHGIVLRVYDVSTSGISSKFQEYLNHDVD
jgi:hypothetical protein